ncbi:hypothetical protein IU429_02890 [Nocardia elegans]|uniref:Multi-ubiquitin domain-containing protein n=1 Tax=Nocardia elegans TaxID=300029 RepID=A0ABW6TN59_9NOCA|nr:hypothetical protein [Nocardia elegans]MBF6446606.1 hypothetical protein [Nocardia elegans]
MGQILVNGETIDLDGNSATAADLKRVAGVPASDWVMANMPTGKVQQLKDTDQLPAGVQDFTVTPAFTYGSAAQG